jgi:probable F420-dependent oxidoreductase
MKFGVHLPGTSPVSRVRWDGPMTARAIADVSKKADALGFDLVAAPDHIVLPEAIRHFVGPKWYDGIATLSYIAGMTKRVRLLTSITVLPWRSPFTIAKAVATLDVLSGGRMIFGVGVGHLKAEFEALGVPYSARGPRFEEAVGLIRRLWTEEAVTHHGRFYHCDEMVLDPKPVQQPVPMWVGGNTRREAIWGFTIAEGWLPFAVPARTLREQTEHARKIGGGSNANGKSFDLVTAIRQIHLGDEPIQQPSAEDIDQRAREGQSEYYRRIAARNLDSSTLRTVEEVVGEIDKVKSVGATGCMVNFRCREPQEFLEGMDWFAEKVMPRYG